MKKNWEKTLAYLLVVIICINTINIPVFAQDNVVTSESLETVNEISTGESVEEIIDETVMGENESLVSDEEQTAEIVLYTDEVDDNKLEQLVTEKVFESDNYRIIFTLISNWDSGYNANFKLENIGDSVIHNWYIKVKFDNCITNIWNAEVFTVEDEEYVIKNVGWNQDIAVGNCVEFGISGDNTFNGAPYNCELIGTSAIVSEEGYKVQFIVDGEWDTGFYGSLLVTNNTDTDLEDWILEFDFNREITQIWNGVIEKYDGNHYVVRNAEYNSTIIPGESKSIGIKGSGGAFGDEPINYKLYSYEIEDTKYIELADGKIDRNYLEQAIYPYLLMNEIPIENIKLSDDFDNDGLSLHEEYI